MKFQKAMILAVTLFTASSTMSSAHAQAEQWLKPFEARYVVTRGGSDYGDATRTLTPEEEGRYSVRMVTDISWLFLSDKRTLFSEFSFAPSDKDDATISLRAHKFRYERTGTGSDKSFAADFDHDAEQILSLETGLPIEVAWQPGLVDEATALVQLQLDIAAFDERRNRREVAESETAADAPQWRYQVIDEKGKRDELVFKLVPAPGHEDKQHYRHVLDLPYGKIEVLAVQRVRENSSRSTDYWFAPELGYNLVRMKQSKDGDETATLELSSFQHQ